jgi:Mor family transcriptional regulator
MGRGDTTLARDMILLCSDAVGQKAAHQGVRALFRHFGGQILYIPLRSNTGKSARKIHGILAATVGDNPARKILDRLMFRFGGMQIYIALERYAFRKNIAMEIYERNYKQGVPVNDLAREYGISFSFAYTLWREGQKFHNSHLSKSPPSL